MGGGVDGPSFVIGSLMGRRRQDAGDPLAITPSTGVGWLRVIALALVVTGAAMWLAETRWDRRAAVTDPSPPHG